MEYTQEIDLSEMVIHCMCSACSVDRSSVGLETFLLDVGLDSMAMTAIVAQVEAAWDCELTTEQIVSLFDTVQVKDLIAQLTSAVKASRTGHAPIAAARE